jgi:hypothetical protein
VKRSRYTKAFHEWLEREWKRSFVRVRINLLETECTASFEGYELQFANGMYKCFACGSWELCDADCYMAPWNLDRT